MNHWTDPLQHIACADGIEDGRQYDTFADWWRGTQRIDYMLWLADKIEYPDDRKLRLLACRFIREIAVDTTRTVWDLLTDERSRSAVEVAERYAVGEARKGELEAAARAASSAARAASSVAWAAEWEAASAAAWVARATARAAAWEAWVASAAACAAAWAATSAATAAACAAEWAAAWAARVSALAQQAGIIRDMIPAEEIVPLFERYIQTLQGEAP